MWFACTGFLINWVVLGFVWMSGYQECRESQFYLGYYDFWAASVVIFMCWLLLLDLVCLFFMSLGIYNLEFFKKYKFAFRYDYSLCLTVVHLLVFEPLVRLN